VQLLVQASLALARALIGLAVRTSQAPFRRHFLSGFGGMS
jgi:hypothetical protein